MMAKKSKVLSRWSITLLVGYIEAADQKAAIEAAAKEFKIAEAVRDRIVARREERFWAASMIWPDTLAIGLLVIATIALAIAAALDPSAKVIGAAIGRFVALAIVFVLPLWLLLRVADWIARVFRAARP